MDKGHSLFGGQSVIIHPVIDGQIRKNHAGIILLALRQVFCPLNLADEVKFGW